MGRFFLDVDVFSGCSGGSTSEGTAGLLWVGGYFSYSVQFTCETLGRCYLSWFNV